MIVPHGVLALLLEAPRLTSISASCARGIRLYPVKWDGKVMVSQIFPLVPIRVMYAMICESLSAFSGLPLCLLLGAQHQGAVHHEPFTRLQAGKNDCAVLEAQAYFDPA